MFEFTPYLSTHEVFTPPPQKAYCIINRSFVHHLGNFEIMRMLTRLSSINLEVCRFCVTSISKRLYDGKQCRMARSELVCCILILCSKKVLCG